MSVCLQCPNELVDTLKTDRKRKLAVSDSSNQLKQKHGSIASTMIVVGAGESIRLQELAASPITGDAKPVSKCRQSTLAECEAAALLQDTQQAIARVWYGCGMCGMQQLHSPIVSLLPPLKLWVHLVSCVPGWRMNTSDIRNMITIHPLRNRNTNTLNHALNIVYSYLRIPFNPPSYLLPYKWLQKL